MPSIRSSAREMPSRTRKLSSPTTTRIVIGARRGPVWCASVPLKYPCARKFRPNNVPDVSTGFCREMRPIHSRAAPVPAPPRPGCIHPIHSVNPRSNEAPGARHDRSPVLALTAGVAMNEIRMPQRRAGARAVLVEPAADALPFDVVESKLRPPAAPAGAVSRTALVNRLRADLGARAVSVVAPGGYGKTTLLAQWAARDERRFAWITLDRRDNDPIVLLRHLAAAVDGLAPIDGRALERARRSEAVVYWSTVVPRVTSALAAAEKCVLVVEDAHVLCGSRTRSRSCRCSPSMSPRARQSSSRAGSSARSPRGCGCAAACSSSGRTTSRSRAARQSCSCARRARSSPARSVRICSTGPRAGRGPSSSRRSRRGGRPACGRRPTSPRSRLRATTGSSTTYLHAEYLDGLERGAARVPAAARRCSSG